MDFFEDKIIKQILQAVNKMHEMGTTPARLYANKTTAMRIVKLFNDNFITTRGKDGNNYIWGMIVFLDDRLDNDTVYLM